MRVAKTGEAVCLSGMGGAVGRWTERGGLYSPSLAVPVRSFASRLRSGCSSWTPSRPRPARESPLEQTAWPLENGSPSALLPAQRPPPSSSPRNHPSSHLQTRSSLALRMCVPSIAHPYVYQLMGRHPRSLGTPGECACFALAPALPPRPRWICSCAATTCCIRRRHPTGRTFHHAFSGATGRPRTLSLSAQPPMIRLRWSTFLARRPQR